MPVHIYDWLQVSSTGYTVKVEARDEFFLEGWHPVYGFMTYMHPGCLDLVGQAENGVDVTSRLCHHAQLDCGRCQRARHVQCLYRRPRQEDIREAIADVCRHYPIDRSNIVLAGFSMGGYGVYRTHYETPGMYKALAVFCGISIRITLCPLRAGI